MSGSGSDEETLLYGTPLEPYEEDEVPTKKMYQQQQTDQHAVDDQGRRRFHGAFTGGFSAGYFNSVGTPEGWTPTSFRSTRSEKANKLAQRPEDFMDEEDRGEFGIAPKLIQTQSDFTTQKRTHKRFFDGPIPGEPVLEQLLRPVHETVAVRILQAMGWRAGQGAGERQTSKQKKKAKEAHTVYGCYLPPELQQNTQAEEENSSSESEFEYETLFAPDDYEPYILKRKNDVFGLGYSGLSRHSVLGNLVGEYDKGQSTSHLVMKDKGKKVSIRGQAFGVGALEDDDEDIYCREDMTHYDYTIGGPEEELKKPKQKFHNIIEGFVPSAQKLPSLPSYPPPSIPKGYMPCPAGTRRSRFEPTTDKPRDQGLGRHELTAEARGNLLGESPIPPPKEPSEPSAIDPIAKLLGRNVNFVSTEPKNNNLNISTSEQLITTSQPITTSMPDYIPISTDNKTEYNTFKPFASNLEKQLRYEKYLQDGDAGRVLKGDGCMDKLSEWERNRELMEFEQAAKLYKPLSGAMGDRFTHGKEPDEALNPLVVVARSKQNRGPATKEQIDAASKGLFGAPTRTTEEWRPLALVCKRFNVPDPFIMKDTPKTEKASTYSIFDYLEAPVHNKDSFTKEQSSFSGSKSTLKVTSPQEVEKSQTIEEPTSLKRTTAAELFQQENETSNKDFVTDTMNKDDKMALYRSIFLSDSEDDEPITNTGDKNSFADAPKNVERNNSPPRGIFANINFDELNSWNRSIVEDKQTEIVKQTSTASQSGASETETYGPKLPHNFNVKSNENVSIVPTFRSKKDREKDDDSSSSDSWVDAKEAKQLKKKKNKKHKSKHKKRKHKKKSK